MGLFDTYINKQVTRVLAQHQHANIQRLNSQDLINFINSGLPTINPDTQDYYNPYSTIGAVYEAVTLIAGKVQNSPFVFYKVKDKRKAEKAAILIKTGNPAQMVKGFKMKSESLEETDSPQLESLLNKPNPYMDGSQFINTLAQCYLLRGNAYMYGNKVSGKPKELFLFPEMEIVTRTGEYLDPILGYKLLIDGYQSTYDKDDIYHFKTANPVNIDSTYRYLYGVAPLRAYLEALRSLKEGANTQSKMMNSGGVFGIVSPKNQVDQFSTEQRASLKQSLVEARKSNDELARLFASSISLDYTPIGLSSSDLDLISSMRFNNEQVYRAFGIPSGYFSVDAMTYNNAETFTKQLVFNAIAPVTDAIGRGLTEFVGRQYGVEIMLDYMQLPDMSIVMESMTKHLVPLVKAGILSPNETREILGYGASNEDGMDKYYINDKPLSRLNSGNQK